MNWEKSEPLTSDQRMRRTQPELSSAGTRGTTEQGRMGMRRCHPVGRPSCLRAWWAARERESVRAQKHGARDEGASEQPVATRLCISDVADDGYVRSHVL